MSSSLLIDRHIAHLARDHAGLVPHQVLLQLGMEKAVIQRRVKSGLLFPVVRGVSSIREGDILPAHRAVAAALVVPHCVVSHRAAASLRGAPIPENLVVADVSLPSGVRTRLRLIRSHEVARAFEFGHVSWMHGVQVSSPHRNVLEVAQVVDADLTELILDHYLHTRQANLERLQRVVNGWGRGWGTSVVGQLVDDRLNGQGIVRSWLEQQCDKVIRKAGLPAPVRNFEVRVKGRKRVLDLAWPALRIGVEADSWQHHESSGDWGNTRTRDRSLQASGWLIVPCVVADTRAPQEFIDALLATHDLRTDKAVTLAG